MHFFVRGDPIFRIEDNHCCDKHWCQFYKHTNNDNSKSPLIRFVEYLREFHKLHANTVLVHPIVLIMRVWYSSGSASHHPYDPLDSMDSVTHCTLLFQEHQHRLLQRCVLLERTEDLLRRKLTGTILLLCLSGSFLWVAIIFLLN